MRAYQVLSWDMSPIAVRSPSKGIQRTAEFEQTMRSWILQTTCTCAMGICTHNTCNTL